jgi:hypothetical protein
MNTSSKYLSQLSVTRKAKVNIAYFMTEVRDAELLPK